MDLGTSLVKNILFVFNTLCSICGIVLIIFGVLSLNSVADLPGHEQVVFVSTISVGVIALGAVVLFISFLGCCGAIRESYCMCMTYSVLLLLLLIVHCICIIAFWINKDSVVNAMGNIVDHAWEERSRQPSIMNALQASLKCCGSNGPTDYALALALPPSTCCEANDCSNPLNIWVSGCKGKMIDLWSGHGNIITYVGLIIAAIEFVGFTFGCCLANNIRNYKRRGAY